MSKHKKRTAVHVLKNPKESNEKLLSRFQKKVQGSKILVLAKARMFYKKPMRKKEIRAHAIMREYHRSQREKQKFL